MKMKTQDIMIQENINKSNTFNEIYCPLTGNKAEMVIIDNHFGRDFPVAFCQESKLYFFVSPPSKEQLNEFYTNQYYDDFKQNKTMLALKFIFNGIRSYSQYRYISKFIKQKKGTILEIGAGTGNLLYHFKNNGWEVHGIEFNRLMIEEAKKRMDISLEPKDLMDIKGIKFDLILMSHALEHFSDINSTISKCRELLTHEGILFVEVPDSPLPGNWLKTDLFEYLNTAHIYNFTPLSLRLLMEKYNLEVIDQSKYLYNTLSFFEKDKKNIENSIIGGTLINKNPFFCLEVMLSFFYMFLFFLLRLDPLRKTLLNGNVRSNAEFLRIIVKKKYLE